MEMFRQHLRWYALGALVVVNFLIWQAVVAESRGGILTVAFLDVGQGDAIFIETPSGAQVLVDGGPNKAVLRELGKVMPFYDRSIDVVIATHPDLDHIGGLPDIFGRYYVDYFLEPGVSSGTGAYRALEAAVAGSSAARFVARRGMTLSFGDGVSLRILFPDRDVSGVDPNDASIVVQLIYGKTKMLFTGDSPQKIEKYLVDIDGGNLRADILKAGHHGSKTSSAIEFVGNVAPRYAVISRGCDNRYGHPHEEVLEVIKRFEAEVLDTCINGIITFVSDGRNVWKSN